MVPQSSIFFPTAASHRSRVVPPPSWPYERISSITGAYISKTWRICPKDYALPREDGGAMTKTPTWLSKEVWHKDCTVGFCVYETKWNKADDFSEINEGRRVVSYPGRFLKTPGTETLVASLCWGGYLHVHIFKLHRKKIAFHAKSWWERKTSVFP